MRQTDFVFVRDMLSLSLQIPKSYWRVPMTGFAVLGS